MSGYLPIRKLRLSAALQAALACAVLGSSAAAGAQAMPVVAQVPPAAAKAPVAKALPAVPKAPAVSLYVQGPVIDYARLVAEPPSPDSAEGKADAAVVHHVQETRTPAQVKAAQQDDLNESMFLYEDVLGPKFRAEMLPVTAAFSTHLRRESSVVNPALKRRFARPRPYIADKTVHLVCEPSQANAYPSGHAMVGYLEGFALAQMVPEKSDAILSRAREYAENRIVCGAHYPSDIEASHTVALALFGSLSTSPVFQQELSEARKETRAALGFPTP